MTDTLLDLEVSQRAEAGVFDVCDSIGTKLGRITGQGGSLRVDVRSNHIRTMTGVMFDDVTLADVNPLTDWLRPTWRLSDGREFAMGLLAFETDPTTSDADTTFHSPTLADGALYLDQSVIQTLGGSMGEQVTSVMQRVLEAAGVPRFVIAPNPTTLLEPIVWPSGSTTWDQVLRALCRLAQFSRPYFDRYGICQLGPPRTTGEPASVFYTGMRVERGSRSTNTNLLSAPNAYMVLGTGATTTPVVGLAYVRPDSPHSKENRGRTILSVERAQGIQDAATAQQMAETSARTNPADFDEISFRGPADPRHDVYSIVDLDGTHWREVSWSLDFRAGGSMSHTLTRGSGD